MNHDIAIIGAGAAGCFAAANIPLATGRRVVIFERSTRPLQKVKISGGGRCNVTHALFDVPELSRRYPRGERVAKKLLHHFSPKDTINWFSKRGIIIKQEADGRMFPATDSSQTIIDCLLRELAARQVDICYQKLVVRLEKITGGLLLHFADGASFQASGVIVATGGYPKPEQFSWLTDLGHHIAMPVPSLFTFNLPKHPITSLMGVAVSDALVKINGTKIITRGPVLITHWGLSGPAILRASAYGARDLAACRYDATAVISWLPDETDESLKALLGAARQQNGRQQVINFSALSLPKRLWQFLVLTAGITEETRWAELSAPQQNKLQQMLLHHEFGMRGKTTYKEEFVTAGGISLSEVNIQTLESKLVEGLHFAGEVLDVDGITGGFNFQWAWCSGWLAAKAMSSKV